MKKHFFLIVLLFFSSILLACSSDDKDIVEPTLELGRTSVDFNNEASTQNVMVATNVELWKAQSDKGWCHVTVNDASLNISVEASEERLIREATVTVTADSQTKKIRVRQLGYEAAILADHDNLEMSVAGGRIDFNITTNVDVEISLPDWIVERSKVRSPEMVTKEYSYTVKANAQDDKRTGNIVITEVLPAEASKEDKPATAEVLVVQHGLNEYDAGDGDDIKGDIKIKVANGTASSVQGGEGIEKSFDGDYNTIYHSKWDNKASDYFPITLTYNLEKESDVDYLVYYPRKSGYNGRFKEVEIQYSVDGGTYQKLMDKDFQGVASATKVLFDKTVHAKSFRFIVKSGAGDGQGFASCAEMEFYVKDPEAFDYHTLFTDETCSELKNGIGETDIERCEFPFFKNMAYYMLKGKYNTEFRVDEFKAYPHPDIQSRTHKTNPYSLLDNPTGISVKANETLIVFVGDMHGYHVSLRVQNLDVPGGDGFGGVSYPLSEGVNKLTMSEKGLVYVMYHTNTLDDPAALPIKIHFASGTVNGYFDSQKHKGRWNELIGKASDKYFDLVGKYAHLTFETSDLRQHASSSGDKLIDTYDEIVHREVQLLGLEAYDKMFRNRLYLNVMYHSYMYATSYHTAYNQSTMGEICNPDKLRTTACWGPAHEIGHCNQTRLGVMWIGTTEVTNNIMSEYIQTTVFGQNSRIQAEDMGMNYRNRYSKAWTQIIVPRAPHADFGDPNNKGQKESDVFCKLVPFWQLELYFGKVLHRTPLQQSDKGGFYPEVYEYARNKNYNGMNDGAVQLDFVYNCCLAAKMNLLDFFEKWGFLAPINKTVEDYATRNLTVTEGMADELRAKVNALGYPKPGVALEYISDNTYELYKNKPAVVRGENVVRNDKTLTIKNWQNVVAYEVKDAAGRLVFISSGETTPSDTDHFTLLSDWKEGYKLYAVSVTGEAIEIPVN